MQQFCAAADYMQIGVWIINAMRCRYERYVACCQCLQAWVCMETSQTTRKITKCLMDVKSYQNPYISDTFRSNPSDD